MLKLIKLLSVVLMASSALAQTGAITVAQDSVTLDSTASDSRFISFPDRGLISISGTFSAQASLRAEFTDHFLVSVEVDSLKASSAVDSLAGGIIPLDHSGNVLSDTVFFDFTNNDTASAKTYYDASSPFNRTSPTRGTTEASLWADVSGFLRPVPQYKIFWDRVGTSANDSVKVRYKIHVGAQ